MIICNHTFNGKEKSWCDFSFYLGKNKFVVAWCTPDFFRRERADEIEDNREDANTLVKSDSFITPVFLISFSMKTNYEIIVNLVCEASVVKDRDLDSLVSLVINCFQFKREYENGI